MAALHREIAEELGLTLTLGAELVPDAARGTRWPLTETLEMRLWLASVAGGEVAGSTDHDQLRWVGAADLADLDWLPGDRAVVEALRPVLSIRVRAHRTSRRIAGRRGGEGNEGEWQR